MKKIINGKMYNSETARYVGSYSWSNSGDFSYFEETLYCKRTGEYFIYGHGGAMSKYAQSEGQNSWSGGEDISPMTYKNARQWAEDHLDPDVYEKEFGEIEEDDTNTVMAISLPASVADKIRKEAQIHGISISGLIKERFMDL